MDEGRLGDVRRREDTHRKYMCVINDVTKSRWQILDGYLKRDQHETIFRLKKSVINVRKDLIRQRVLQQCMKMRRDALSYPETILGRYGGKPAEAFSRDVDDAIETMHPKLRRMRRLQKLKLQCIREGAILLPSDVETKINDYFKRVLSEKRQKSFSKNNDYQGQNLDLFSKKGKVLRPLPDLKKSFHKISLDADIDDEEKPKPSDAGINKVNKTKREEKIRNTKSTLEPASKEDVSVLESSREGYSKDINRQEKLKTIKEKVRKHKKQNGETKYGSDSKKGNSETVKSMQKSTKSVLPPIENNNKISTAI